MLYPRENKNGDLVADDQLVGIIEHLAREKRLLFLTGVINDDTMLHNALFALDTLSYEPITLVITSPGGNLDSAFLLYDTVKLLQSPLITFGRYCASAAVLLLAAGSKRYLSPHAKVMLHLPSGQAGGDSRDWEIQHREMQKYKNKMVEILIECGAKKPAQDILQDVDRDFWLEPEEAIAYGLADEIITRDTMKRWLK